MLKTIHIRNLALTRDLDLDLGEGLTVLTGETGAGKSIFVEALTLALGQAANERHIHQQADRAEISLSFDITRLPHVRDWLAEHELDDGDECLLRRVLLRQGRNKAYINGSLVAQQRLAELGQLLIDIHGQHAQHALLRSDYQRRLLDDYGGHGDLLASIGQCHRQCQTMAAELERRLATHGDQSGLELLRYQVDELERLAMADDEWQRLTDEHQTLAHAEELVSTCATVLDRLTSGQGSIDTELQDCIEILDKQSRFASRLRAIVELLQEAAIQVGEAGSELRHELTGFDVDPQALKEVEHRLDEIMDLARKHHVRPETLPELTVRLQQRLADAEGGRSALAELEQALADERRRYHELAVDLRRLRETAARHFAAEVTAHLRELGMASARFEVGLESLPDDHPSVSGLDRVRFLVSMHPSLPLTPIERAASGGELSRISLAIDVVTSRQGAIPTLLFDEVDVGIGGRIAEIVGQHLRRLGRHRQVVCITHLAQVAAQGGHHLAVSKQVTRNEVVSLVQALSLEARREEIARMLGGVEITPQTRAHAQELLERAQATATEDC